MNGRFITLEGGEGVGKSTQAQLLAATLSARGIQVIITREPGGSPGAEAIRELLLSRDAAWSARTEAVLFAAARGDHVANTIRPALECGSWVVCDRFIDSSRAYQGAGGVPDEEIMRLHAIGSGSLMPDRTLLLALRPEQAAARADARDAGMPDRIGARDWTYHARVGALLNGFAAAEPDRFRRIDAGGPAEAVTARLLAALDGLTP